MPPCALNHVCFPHPSLPSRGQSYESQSAQSFTANLKRHSEGTFTGAMDLRTPATLTGSDPGIPLRMQRPSEGFQFLFD